MNDLAVVGDSESTDLEMLLLDKKVSEWKAKRIDDLQREIKIKELALIEAAPKVASFDALMRSEKTISITQACKYFGIHPKTEAYPYFRAKKYINRDGTPSQTAIDAHYLALRENFDEDHGVTRKQAVVLKCDLETWRVRVVPQIMAWIREQK